MYSGVHSSQIWWEAAWGISDFLLSAMLVKTVFIAKRQLSYTLNRLKQGTKIWQHLKQLKRKGVRGRQFSPALESRETSLYLKMPQVQEIASHRLAKA